MNRLQKLVGKRFAGLYRVVDMLVLDFGDDVFIFEPFDPTEPLRSEYSLRFMCQWRFVKDGKILLGSRDIYLPWDERLDDLDWEYDLCDRPDAQSSVFDVAFRAIEEPLLSTVVESVTVNSIGDLKIVFSDGSVFESFTPSGRADEFWRMVCFYPDRDSEHLVVFDTYEKEAEQ